MEGISHSVHGQVQFTWPVAIRGYTWWPQGKGHAGQVIRCAPVFRLPVNSPPYLVPVGPRTARRQPLIGRKARVIHRNFARLKDEAIDREILRFASEHGLLTSGVEVQVDGKITRGDSLALWWRQVVDMGQLLALWDVAASGSDKDLKALTPNGNRISYSYTRENGKCAIAEYDVRVNLWFQKAFGFSGRFKPESFDLQAFLAYGGKLTKPPPGMKGNVVDTFDPALGHEGQLSPRDAIKLYVANKITEHLPPIKAGIVPLQWDRIRLTPGGLLDALWLSFLWEIVDEPRKEVCRYCHEWFVPSNTRQKFCTNSCRQNHWYSSQWKKNQSRKTG